MTTSQLLALQSAQGKGTEKLIVFIVLALSIVGIWYFGFRKPTTTAPTAPKPATATNPATNTNSIPANNQQPTTNSLNVDLQLQKGSKGAEVKALQVLCNKIAVQKGVAKLSVDGDFGTKTEAFVTQYFPPYLTLKTAQAWAKTMYNIE